MAALHARHDQEMVGFYTLFSSAILSKSQYSTPNRRKTWPNYVLTLSVK